MEVTEDDVAAKFTFTLKEGDIEVQSWFNDEDGEPMLGAYYMYVNRK